MGFDPTVGSGAQAAIRAVSIGSAEAPANLIPAGAALDPAANRVRLTTARVNLTVVAAPPGTRALSSRIAGLTNATLVIPARARVRTRHSSTLNSRGAIIGRATMEGKGGGANERH